MFTARKVLQKGRAQQKLFKNAQRGFHSQGASQNSNFYSTQSRDMGSQATPPPLNLKSLNLGSLKPQLPFTKDKEYDLIVIGGGSGGITAALEARSRGLEVALFDYIEPTVHGTQWGLGGTCVNVGCIPKKLFHIATLVKENLSMAEDYGFKKPQEEHEWTTLRHNIQQYIKMNNYEYVQELKEAGVDYINAKASFLDKKTVSFELQKEKYQLKAKTFLVATGTRPRQYPGVDLSLCITSDDLFSLEENPGETLVLGGGYIAVECAGFLSGLGNKVHLANRSTFLRTFDQDCAQRITEQLQDEGIFTYEQTTVKNIERVGEKKLKVTLNQNGKEVVKEVQTVLVAVGRDTTTKQLNLKDIGVDIQQGSGKVAKGKEFHEKTNLEHIYAVGDVLEGVPELMPVAQKSGKNIGQTIAFDLGKEDSSIQKTDYNLIPTTVFCPTEYAFVGLNEEEAVKELGNEIVEVFLRETTPLEYKIFKKNTRVCFMKVIVDLKTDRVIGLHFIGPKAEEIISGYALAMKLGLTKSELDGSFGVHPSTSEDLHMLRITKRSGKDFVKGSC